MQKIASILLGIFLIAVHSANAQSCCKKPEGMQVLALTKSFKASHEAPLPLNYSPEKGSMIQFGTQNGPDGNAFYVPSEGASDRVLIIFHEWWGLNDYIKREAERWQSKLGTSVAVYAVDLYDGKVASTPDEASKLASSLDAKRGEAIIKGLLQKVGNDKKIATLGWCMGGTWSFTGAILSGSQAAGCVMYYGFPEKDIKRIKPLNCDVLYIRGSKDNFIKESDVLEFENKIKTTGHNITMYSFDAVHAFANPSNPHYNEKAADEAERYTYKFLKQKLGL